MGNMEVASTTPVEFCRNGTGFNVFVINESDQAGEAFFGEYFAVLFNGVDA